MVKFIEHGAELMVQEIDKATEEAFNIEKEKIISRGIMEIDQLYNKKTKMVHRETAT